MAVPARNEADTIVECLRSIDVAAMRVGAQVTVVLAADGCHDETVALAHSAGLACSRLAVIEGSWGRVGAGRAAAVGHGLRWWDDLARTWIANTDADCVVPSDWLMTQLTMSSSVAAIAGVVGLDPSSTSAPLLSEFLRTYPVDGDHHRHVHGANLGVRADAYASVGGWCTRTRVGEDHALWRAVRAGGYAVSQTTALHVRTSSRTLGRVEGGFASDLRRLEALASTAGAVG